jgi:predicted unusual protein kinase regulating ubiquinone biosynthesis (AarF/ABC1/UbiB family)
VKRYAEIGRVLLRNRRSLRIARSGETPQVDDEETGEQGVQLAADLEAMGPTFVKLGQLLSTRSDLLPPSQLEALARLQDEVAPFPAAEARGIFEDDVTLSVDDAFAAFDDAPLASASLGQVHRARLHDGRRVVVKVQRPGIEAQVADDLGALAEIAEFLDGHTDAGRRFGFQDLLDEFRRSITEELDYRHEASHLLRLATILPDDGRLFVPRPVAELTGHHVLTMDEVAGRKVTDLAPSDLTPEDRSTLADELLRAYLEQIFVHGFFHADPHPGNLIVTDDGRLGLIDLGMVGHIRHDVRAQLVKLLLAVEDGRGQDAGEVLVRIGKPLDDFDEQGLLREVADLVARRQGLQLADLKVGELITELSHICGASGLRPPPELALLARALLNLDGVTRALDPRFDPAAAIRRHAADIFSSQMRTTTGGVMALVEAREFAEQLPGRVNRVMEALAHGELTVKVHAFDEAEMLRNLTKIANRLAMGLVIAALLLGAAVMTKAYPRIALGCFALAGACGVALMTSIVLSDRDIKSRIRRKRGT